jgi:ADP-heptose:LPS heptosyltransferase
MFDASILPRPDDPWSGALVRSAEIPVRLGYTAARTRPYLTHAFPEPAKCHVSELGLHLADHLITLLDGEQGSRGDGGDEQEEEETVGRLFLPTPQDEAEAERALSEMAARTGRRPVLLHPGAGWAIKRWLAARWGRLAGLLAARYGTLPLVITGPGEEQLERTIIEESGGIAAGLARPLSLGALAALHRRSRLVVGIDSGPLHLAAMMGCPVVALYGPADPVEFRPLCASARLRVVAIKLACSPCGTLLNPPCGTHTDPACMTGISVEQVFSAAADLLEQAGDNDHSDLRGSTTQVRL